jgi:hypothetical protein
MEEKYVVSFPNHVASSMDYEFLNEARQDIKYDVLKALVK